MSLLRTLKSKYKGAEIIPFSVTSSGACTNNQISVAKTGTGEYTITPTWSYVEPPFIVAQPISGASAIRYAQVPAATNTKSSSIVEIRTVSSGALIDTAFNGFLIGSRALDLRYYRDYTEFPAKVGCFRNRFSYIEYDGTTQRGGTGEQIGVMSNPSTGNYTLTFNQPVTQTPVVIAHPDDKTDTLDINAVGTSAITFKLRRSNSSAHNGKIHIFVMTTLASSSWHTGKVTAQINDIGAHIMPFQISATAMVRGGEYFTFTDNGTGDYTLTMRNTQMKPGYFFATPINNDTTALRVGNPRDLAAGTAVKGSINVEANADTSLMGFAVGFSKEALV